MKEIPFSLGLKMFRGQGYDDLKINLGGERCKVKRMMKNGFKKLEYKAIVCGGVGPEVD